MLNDTLLQKKRKKKREKKIEISKIRGRMAIFTHSVPRGNQIKFQIPENKPSQDEWASFKDSKNIVHEILENEE